MIPYCPNGRFVHIAPPFPSSDWANDFGRPWWKDESYLVGILSKKTRFIKIINTLTSQEQVIEVGTFIYTVITFSNLLAPPSQKINCLTNDLFPRITEFLFVKSKTTACQMLSFLKLLQVNLLNTDHGLLIYPEQVSSAT